MIQYRAVLRDPVIKHERVIQTIASSTSMIDSWIAETLGGGTQLQGPAKIEISDQATVEVYVMEERLAATYTVSQAREIRNLQLRRKRGEA